MLKRLCSSQGAVLIEAALAIPVLLLLLVFAVGAAEYLITRALIVDAFMDSGRKVFIEEVPPAALGDCEVAFKTGLEAALERNRLAPTDTTAAVVPLGGRQVLDLSARVKVRQILSRVLPLPAGGTITFTIARRLPVEVPGGCSS